MAPLTILEEAPRHIKNSRRTTHGDGGTSDDSTIGRHETIIIDEEDENGNVCEEQDDTFYMET